MPIHKLSKERATPRKIASLGLISFELSKSKEISCSFVLIIIKIPIHKRRAEPINSHTFVDNVLFNILPIRPDRKVIKIEIKNKIIFDFFNNFVCLRPYVIPIPKESILLEIASKKVLRNIFYHLLIFYENVDFWWK